jgi:5-formyltetrahydrofolate cyclo-ligase
MDNRIEQGKRAMRREVAAKLRELTPAKRENASDHARALLEGQRVWQEARAVLFYAPLPYELDVWGLVEKALAAGKTVGLPRFEAETESYIPCRVENLAEDIEEGRYGIREPAGRCARLAINGLDLILAPGVAFDMRGCRLGRGKGYYDRLLAAARGQVCGVAFDEQIVREVPAEPHDVFVNCILTPTRWIEL